ncbi:MAG: hypothetical protein RLZZ272_5 [Actinomycetota bacterium]|jgi:ABC-type nitrate/sulfonate/bicarbonate transport system substrate-binding protein
MTAIVGKRRRIGSRTAVAVAAVAVLLAACGGAEEATPEPAPAPAATEEAVPAEEAPAPSPDDVEPMTWAHACSLPGCWYHVPMYVAAEFGFFEQFGANVTIQPMRSGGDIVQATQTGDVSGGHIGTDPFLVGAPAGLNMVGIFGENKQDWIVITRDPSVQSCADFAGKQVGAQATGDARWLVLSAILDGCGDGVTIDDVNVVDPNSDYVGVLVSGVLDSQIVHLDELAQVESLTTDEWRTIAALSDLQKRHYAMHVVNKDVLASNRENVVRTLAGIVAATEFMYDPANADAIVAYLSGQGIIKQDDPALAASVFQEFLDFGQWEVGNNGLDEEYLSNSIASLVAAGSIAEAYDPSTILDTSIWDEANERVRAANG